MAAPRRSFSELRVALERSRGELVRTFVREACLSEDVPQATANSIAEDASAIWRGLCDKAPSDAVRILFRCSGQNVKIRILLHGYSRFSAILSEGMRVPATQQSRGARMELTDGSAACNTGSGRCQSRCPTDR